MLEGLVLAAALLGCGGAPMSTQLPVSRSRTYGRTIDTLGVESTIGVPAERIWAVLPAVFADLGLGINFREPAARRTGTCYQEVRGRLGKELLSTFLDCGDTRSLPNADRYQVAITVLSTVQSRGLDEAAVYTFVLGVGQDASGTGSQRVWCFSKGALERRIRDALLARLAA